MKIITTKNTQAKIKKGVDKICDIVKVTLGGKGKNVIINNGIQNIQIINDGVTIAREVELENIAENTGAMLARQVAEKTNDEAGDGTTTTLVMLQAFLQAMEGVETNDVRGLREEIKAEVDKVVEELDKRKKPIKDGDIENIAYISSLDREIAKTIAELVKKIGKDGVVSVEDAKVAGIQTEVVNGIKIDDGYITPYFITNKETLKAEIKEVPILLTKKSIATVNDILPLLEELARKNINKIVIMCEDITDEVLGFLVANKLKGMITPLVVKTSNMEDIAVVTGGEIVTPENQKEFTSEALGNATKIECGKFSTTVIGSESEKQEVQKKIEELKAQIKNTEDEIEMDRIKQRIAKLSGGVSVVRIAGDNAQETKEKKLKLEDALNSVRAAMEDGIVEGGGMALYKIGEKLSKDTPAQEIVSQVIMKPFIQILENAEENKDEVLTRGDNSNIYNAMGGYNVITRKWENFYDTGVIDPVKVTKSALKNAFAMGNQILTAEAGIFQKNEKGK